MALDGHSLHDTYLETIPILLKLSGNHQETIKKIVINYPQLPVILGATWLSKHNPLVNWREKVIVVWSEKCLSMCLFNAVSPTVAPGKIEETYPDLSKVP